mmetsp:Transcript_12431/g.46408  ORF Transcript_12431/g.46408 Transcript_12431/m.46408 type:complete len:203 (+) Transcript_12431:2195-2803(+)
MIRFGGSPIMVDVPPMFPKSAIGMSMGLGSISMALHNEIITGPSNSIVLTLSRNALNTQSKSISIHVNRHMSIPLYSMRRTEQNSKTPDRANSATMIIIPQRSANVPWSIHCMISYTDGKRCSSARRNKTAAAPMNAIKVRCTTSVMISANTPISKTSAIQCCNVPTGPIDTTSKDTPNGFGQSVQTCAITLPPERFGLTSK